MKSKVIIVGGCHSSATVEATINALKEKVEIVVNPAKEPQPMEINNIRKLPIFDDLKLTEPINEVKLIEPKRNKYFYKPRYNFKKR